MQAFLCVSLDCLCCRMVTDESVAEFISLTSASDDEARCSCEVTAKSTRLSAGAALCKAKGYLEMAGGNLQQARESPWTCGRTGKAARFTGFEPLLRDGWELISGSADSLTSSCLAGAIPMARPLGPSRLQQLHQPRTHGRRKVLLNLL